MDNFGPRYSQLLGKLQELKLDGLVVTHPPNLNYLFNFSGSSGIAYCLDGQAKLLVDSRYLEQAQDSAVNCEVELTRFPVPAGLKSPLENSLSSGNQARLGVEMKHLSHQAFLEMESWRLQTEWVPTSDLVEELRTIKSSGELARMRRAFKIAHAGYDRFLQQVAPGCSEIELAGLLEFELRKAGGEGISFDTIVASGPRSSLPHGLASSRVLQEHEILLCDFGIVHRSYCSDLTRVHIPAEKSKPEIYEIVREAWEAALETVGPDLEASRVDAAARQVIENYGYGEYFGHSTGHGLGLEVHELPTISSRSTSLLQPGMVFTVEPGIYLPGRYGVRIEDVVEVTETGYSLLSDPDR